MSENHKAYLYLSTIQRTEEEDGQRWDVSVGDVHVCVNAGDDGELILMISKGERNDVYQLIDPS